MLSAGLSTTGLSTTHFAERVSLMNLVKAYELLINETLWLYGRAAERGVRKVRDSIPYEDSELHLCPQIVTRR